MRDYRIKDYTLSLTPCIQEISMPKGSQILSVRMDQDDYSGERFVIVYALILGSAPIITRLFRCYYESTKIDLSSLPHNYVGTCVDTTDYAYHVFDLGESK